MTTVTSLSEYLIQADAFSHTPTLTLPHCPDMGTGPEGRGEAPDGHFPSLCP